VYTGGMRGSKWHLDKFETVAYSSENAEICEIKEFGTSIPK